MRNLSRLTNAGFSYLLGDAGGSTPPVVTGTANNFVLNLYEAGIAVDGIVMSCNQQRRCALIIGDTAQDRMQMVNCVFRGGYDFSYGSGFGAMLVSHARVRLAHCTFVENTCFGGFSTNSKGFRLHNGASVDLENSILWDPGEGALEIRVDPGSTLAVRNSLIRNGEFGGINLDPQFRSGDPPGPTQGLLLTVSSPARDTGIILNVAKTDFQGEPRDNWPDLGADEFVAVDSDNDGLPDEWELLWFGSLAQGANGDPDADGLTNAAEFNHGTIPTDSDTDNDFASDGFEVANNRDPLVSNDYLTDADGDRVPELYETANGTDPNNPNSTPAPHFIVDASFQVAALNRRGEGDTIAIHAHT